VAPLSAGQRLRRDLNAAGYLSGPAFPSKLPARQEF
jgi:hypothetical protein